MSGAELGKRVSRAREIGLGGLARRVRSRLQEPARLRARAEWHARYDREQPDDALLRSALRGTDDGSDLASIAAASRFWFDASDPALRRAFLSRHPDAVASLVREADATLAGDLAWVIPGGVADWHAALPGGGRWPLVPSADLSLGAEKPLGDARLSFEIGRCTHLVRLAQVGWLTGEARYARGVVDRVRDFAAQNPPGRGIAWAHAQEAALRAVALLWSLHLTRTCDAWDAATRRTFLWLLLAHGDFVAAHMEDHPTTHNHLVSEAAGLVVLGIAAETLAPAARWRRLGWRVLFRELAKQVDEEGVQAEHATHYHGFVLDSFLAVLLLADRRGLAVPAAARARIAAMAQALALLLRGDGTLPAIGDTDAGRAFRFGGDPLDRRDTLAAAAIAFDARRLGAIAGDAPGAFWLGGGRPVPGAGDRTPAGVARRFASAGLGIARSGFDRAAESVLFRCGPTRFRPDVLRSHMHADALSLVWRLGDDDVLVDPGTYLYSEADGWRAALRGTAAHSCVVVDRADQADVRSERFGIRGERVARWLAFAGDGTHLVAAAEHPADGTPRVRRRVAWIAGGFLALCDDVLGDGEHAVAGWLQFPASEGEASGAGATLRLAGGRSVLVQAFGDVRHIEVMRPARDAAPGPGWRAPRYGMRVPGTALRLDAGTLRLPARIVALLQVGSGGAHPVAGRVEDMGDALRVHAGAHTVCFDGAQGVQIEARS